MTNQSTIGVSPASDTKKYFAEAVCTPDQKLVERVAWRDALHYAQALASWQPNGSFQAAMDLYMGNDSRGQLGATLQANIDGADNHYIVFCPRYYEYPSLLKSLSFIDALPTERLLIEPAEYFYGNQGQVYFHESLHFADLTTPVNHPIVDYNGNESYTYGPHDVAMEAQSKNTAASLHIADAYTCAAAAIFVQQRYNLADPPKPLESLPRQNLGSRAKVRDFNLFRPAQLPNPDTHDNHIISNDFGIGPTTPIIPKTPESTSSRQPVPGSTSPLKRVAWPLQFPCTLGTGVLAVARDRWQPRLPRP
ncbi:MAG: hypothetical protein ASARMPREDX12_003100 [Alectoria sarmentosa]|nr:MAG: hypothetical protein ASARMPREDX12_003100 [Alectoria sarmentosa]